jgi:hypothetical protein
MIPPTPGEPWDDVRLEAAFEARAARSMAPVELAAATAATLRRRPARRSPSRLAMDWAAAFALVVVATGGLVLLVNSDGKAPGTSPDGTTPEPTTLPAPSETPTDGSSTPEAVIGLPVMSVSDAIAIRDAGIDDREIAVRGWYAPYYPTRACGFPTRLEPVSPLQAGCPDDRLWLMQDPEPVITATGSGISWRGPTGPAINPEFDEIDMSWVQPIDDVARLEELVVVGHFDDRRSNLCPRAEQDVCRERFVVDRVSWVDGETLPTSVLDLFQEQPPATPFADVKAALDRITGGAPVLSAIRVDGPIGLASVEPSLGTGQANLIDHDALWVVRVLASEGAATYLLVDGSDAFYQMDATGTATEVSATGPSTPPVADTVLGRPVLSVPEAIALRDAPTTEEIVVRGWALRSSSVYDCAIHMDPHHPLVPFCQPPVFLMERPETQVSTTTAGPSIPMLIGPDAHNDVAIPSVNAVEVIAIGHFLDHRWPTCPGAYQAECQVEFVVDQLIPADARVDEIPAPWSLDPTSPTSPTIDLASAVARLEERIGHVALLSAGHLAGPDLASIEPGVGDLGFAYEEPFWLLRVLTTTDSSPRTYLLRDTLKADELALVFEVSSDRPEELPRPGDPTQPPPRTPAPPSTPSADGRIRVELWGQRIPDAEPVQVTIVDRSELVTSAREVRPDDPPWTDSPADDAAVMVDPDGHVRLVWIDTICQGDTVVTIAEDFETIDIDGGTRAGCDAMAVTWELVLEVAEPVDTDTTRVTYRVTVVPEG